MQLRDVAAIVTGGASGLGAATVEMLAQAGRLGQPAESAQRVASIIALPMLNGETIRLGGASRRAPK